jgi:hypothetical protein
MTSDVNDDGDVNAAADALELLKQRFDTFSRSDSIESIMMHTCIVQHRPEAFP